MIRKLTIEQVREIRDSDLSPKELERKYGMSQSAMWFILTGKTYKEDGMKIRKMPNRGRKQKIFAKDKEVIRKRYFSEDGLRYRHLMEEYGVNNSTIGRVINSV
jgi:transposase